MAAPDPFLLAHPGEEDFVAMCYTAFLGRELESDVVARERSGWPKDEIIRSIVVSDEFGAVLRNLLCGAAMPDHLFRGEATDEWRARIIGALPLRASTRELISGERDRRVILEALLADNTLMRSAGLATVAATRRDVSKERQAGERGQADESGDGDLVPLWTDGAARVHLWR